MNNKQTTNKQNTDTKNILDNGLDCSSVLDNNSDKAIENTQNSNSQVQDNNITDNNKRNDNRVYNIQNLKPVQSKEEARERGRKGGIKSGESRRQRKTLKQNILDLLAMELSDDKLDELGIDKTMLGGDNSLQNAITIAMLKESLNGDTKAYQLLRDTIDEAPTVRQEITETITQEDTALLNDLRKSLIS